MFQISVVAALIFCLTVKSSVSTFLAQRIIIEGGRNTTIEEHPYQISIENSTVHTCGGTLIKPNVVVTAAHCIEPYRPDKLIDLSIRAGSTLRETGGVVANIIRYCDHPKYMFPDYDVSVLILDRNLTLSSAIQPVPLQPVNTNMATGTVGTMTGWGRLSTDGPLPEVLQTLDSPKLSQENCRKLYYDANITDGMMCFGYEVNAKDSCQGDSGGPLIVGGQLAGVISWGYGCGIAEYPTILTRIANEEIYNHILQCIEGDNN